MCYVYLIVRHYGYFEYQYMSSRNMRKNSTQSPIHVVVADDHPLILSAIEKQLCDSGSFVVTAVTTGAELLRILATQEINLIVTDFIMPQSGVGTARDDGLPLLSYIRRTYPAVPIIVFTMISNGGLLTKILGLGVQGIIGKDEPPSALSNACLRIVSGAHFPVLGQSIARRLGTQNVSNTISSSRLSVRELEVVRLFSSGLSITEIARRLNRAVTTVATQKHSAMKKLNLQSNADLVRYATAEGLV